MIHCTPALGQCGSVSGAQWIGRSNLNQSKYMESFLWKQTLFNLGRSIAEIKHIKKKHFFSMIASLKQVHVGHSESGHSGSLLQVQLYWQNGCLLETCHSFINITNVYSVTEYELSKVLKHCTYLSQNCWRARNFTLYSQKRVSPYNFAPKTLTL